MIKRPCLDCGEPTDATRCTQCQPPKRPSYGTYRRPKGDKTYGSAWRRLRKEAIRLQPFCTYAHLGGCEGGIELDHSPRAYDRANMGLAVRLEDCTVVCHRHNIKLGAARGANVTRPYAPDYPGAL